MKLRDIYEIIDVLLGSNVYLSSADKLLLKNSVLESGVDSSQEAYSVMRMKLREISDDRWIREKCQDAHDFERRFANYHLRKYGLPEVR